MYYKKISFLEECVKVMGVFLMSVVFENFNFDLGVLWYIYKVKEVECI